MGIFSKIKNFITGGAADVNLLFEKQTVDGTSPIRLFVTAHAQDKCNIKKIYLQIRARETYLTVETSTRTDNDGNSQSYSENKERTEDHFESKLILAENITLEKDQEEKWLAEFEIPANAIATYHGKDVSFKWECRAGLDMSGVDPASGWQEFFVSKKMNYSPKL